MISDNSQFRAGMVVRGRKIEDLPTDGRNYFANNYGDHRAQREVEGKLFLITGPGNHSKPTVKVKDLLNPENPNLKSQYHVERFEAL
jgi:hypothetical protein